jgi:hypothetical protein
MKNRPLTFMIVCLCVFFFGSPGVSNAQEDQSDEDKSTGTPLSFGLKAGTNFHSFTNQQPHTGSKIGYSGGFFALYSFSETIAVQLDAAYFQQGGRYIQFIDETRFGASEYYSTKYVKDASVTLHNVFLPLQAHISVFDEAYLPDLLVGPYVDINFAATETYEKTGQINDQYVTTVGSEIVTDEYKMLQYGATAALSFTIPTNKNMSVLFDVAYKYGIFPVKESYSYIDLYSVSGDINSNALSVSLGVKF